jgi:excisionase family DNA binding protein
MDQRILGDWAMGGWRRNKSAGSSAATTKAAPSWQACVDRKVAPWKRASRSARLYPIVAEIIEARAGTMVDNDNNKRRRLVEFKDGCRYGKFGKTKAYELIAHERIRAYKMGGKTMIDLDSVDEYHASLPRVETRAS